jgi:hypothetical protein
VDFWSDKGSEEEWRAVIRVTIILSYNQPHRKKHTRDIPSRPEECKRFTGRTRREYEEYY